jgi:hypothetical protein
MIAIKQISNAIALIKSATALSVHTVNSVDATSASEAIKEISRVLKKNENFTIFILKHKR